MKIKSVLIILVYLTSMSVLGAETETLNLESRVQMPKKESATNDLKLGLGIQYGNTSNAVKIQNGPGSDFVNIEPQLTYMTGLTNRLFVIASGEASVVKHNDEVIAQNADSSTTKGSLALVQFFGSHIELGLEGGFKRFRGNEVDFFTGSETGIPSEFDATSTYVSSRYNGNQYAFELGVGYVNQDFSTQTLNESGQIFEDDSTSTAVDGLVEYNLSNHYKVELSGNFEQKKYRQRQAYFSDGLAPNSSETNPLAEENSTGGGIKLTYSVYKSELALGLNSKRTKDKIFGAQDADTLGYSAKLKHNIVGGLDIELKASQSEKTYDTFKADTLVASNPVLTRVDKTSSEQVKLQYQFTPQFVTHLAYSHQVTDSNYDIISFKDQRIQTGLKLEY